MVHGPLLESTLLYYSLNQIKLQDQIGPCLEDHYWMLEKVGQEARDDRMMSNSPGPDHEDSSVVSSANGLYKSASKS